MPEDSSDVRATLLVPTETASEGRGWGDEVEPRKVLLGDPRPFCWWVLMDLLRRGLDAAFAWASSCSFTTEKRGGAGKRPD